MLAEIARPSETHRIYSRLFFWALRRDQGVGVGVGVAPSTNCDWLGMPLAMSRCENSARAKVTVPLQLHSAESYSSALLKIPVIPFPPAASTCPERSSVAV
jgi:hypothetical protein